MAENRDKKTDETEQVLHDEEVADQSGECQDEQECNVHETCEKEKEELTNQLLRLQADFQNYRRRTQHQIEEIRTKANENLIGELLPVMDNFERALMAAKNGEDSFVSGVRMVYQQLLSCLAQQGLQPIDALEQVFDPNFHDAISVEGDDGDDLVVTSEVRKGYIYQGKVIRHSMVQVQRREQKEGDE